MATRAERFRADMERRAQDKKPKRRPRKPPPPDARPGLRERAALIAQHDHPGMRVPHNVAPRAMKNSSYELEADGAGRPPRKSTRKSATRVKTDSGQRIRAVNRTSSPKRRARPAR